MGTTDSLKKTADDVITLFHSMQVQQKNIPIQNLKLHDFPSKGLSKNQLKFFRIEQLSFSEEYPRREAFENVLSTIESQYFNFVYILEGKKNVISLYLGIVQNQEKPIQENLTANNYCSNMENSFLGNFNGSKLVAVTGDELQTSILEAHKKYTSMGIVTGIPSVSGTTKDAYDFQGIDRLINSMMGLEWRMVVICEPVAKEKIQKLKSDIYELYNRFALCAKGTVQQSISEGYAISFGTNVSVNKQEQHTTSIQKGDSKNDPNGQRGENFSKGDSTGESKGESGGFNTGESTNYGSSSAVTIEIANKHAQEAMKYIDEELLERMKTALSKGLFKTSVYYMATDPASAARLKSCITAHFQGDVSSFSPLIARDLTGTETEKAQRVLTTYQNQALSDETVSADAALLLSLPLEENRLSVSTYLTGKEISLLAGLPQKEVPGIALKESIDFGLNEHAIPDDAAICIGKMMQKGKELNIPFKINQNSLRKHTFIAGVTGSGKTTTCHRLLKEVKSPFLVIEPAKTEYRTLVKDTRFENVLVFTIGDETVAPFRLNPFELMKGELISAHVDMLKASFTSAFPMEASMPQLLEEAIYACYEDKQWDVNTNKHIKYGEEAFSLEKDCFPTMHDLLNKMKAVVKEKKFGPELEANYIGSLVSRLSNLTKGSKGNMLNCSHSVDFNFLIENNVVIEMEELKSPEDKAFIMGLILMKLSAVIKQKHKEDSAFSHVTLIEEAHRLLSKVEYSDSGAKKSAVETFADLLAEVRKYGEGLVIVDQIPSKLAPEVIKNTNTKIIHRLLARDDKETVGDTMLMSDKQKEYLSSLSVGEAIIFSENTDKPVHVKIEAASNTSEAEISDDIVRTQYDRNFFRFDHGLYNTFLQVTDSIYKRTIVRDECESLKDGVKQYVTRSGRSEHEVWKSLIREKENGRNNSLELREDREKQLMDFFTGPFQKADFQKSDIDIKLRSLCRINGK